MNLENVNIGFLITGAFSAIPKILPQVKRLVEKEKANVFPIISFNASNMDTRFGEAKDYIEKIEKITKMSVIDTMQDAEFLGIKNVIDVMVIAPATGNTTAKLANGISDTPVLVAAKSHLRNNKPIVLGISTSDGLSTNAVNIGNLLNRRNFYFVPFRQDNPITKPFSIVSDPEYVVNTIKSALEGEQLQPILL